MKNRTGLILLLKAKVLYNILNTLQFLNLTYEREKEALSPQNSSDDFRSCMEWVQTIALAVYFLPTIVNFFRLQAVINVLKTSYIVLKPGLLLYGARFFVLTYASLKILRVLMLRRNSQLIIRLVNELLAIRREVRQLKPAADTIPPLIIILQFLRLIICGREIYKNALILTDFFSTSSFPNMPLTLLFAFLYELYYWSFELACLSLLNLYQQLNELLLELLKDNNGACDHVPKSLRHIFQLLERLQHLRAEMLAHFVWLQKLAIWSINQMVVDWYLVITCINVVELHWTINWFAPLVDVSLLVLMCDKLHCAAEEASALLMIACKRLYFKLEIYFYDSILGVSEAKILGAFYVNRSLLPSLIFNALKYAIMFSISVLNYVTIDACLDFFDVVVDSDEE